MNTTMGVVAGGFAKRAGVVSWRLWSAAIMLTLAGCGGGGYGSSGGGGTTSLTVNLSASPTTVVAGQDVTLTWSSAAGASCTASSGWSGAQPDHGSAVVTPSTAGSVTYTLACSVTGGAYGNGSSGTKSVTVMVTAATGFTATVLVADTSGTSALVKDTSLVNPWGIAFGPGFSWVANNASDTSTLYDGNGKAQPTAAPLVVQLPAPAGATAFAATGVIFNAGNDFVVSAAGKSGPARFLFVGESGAIAGWSPTVDGTHAIIAFADTGGASYKGLAVAANAGANFLYAADFHNGKVDVFDASFARQTPSATSFSFADPTLPAAYAPFNIAAFKTGASGATELYVTYAKQAAPDNIDSVDGAGLGLIDVYDTNGTLLRHLVPTGGHLNGPWGMALAPADLGTLSGALLVGNFGNGTITGFDPATGAVLGTVADSSGKAFALPGLWGIAFGNDADNQPHTTLFYAAGVNNEANGAYGRIDLGGAPTLNAPPTVALTAPAAGGVNGTVNLAASASGSVGIAKVEFFADAVSLGVTTTTPYTFSWNTAAVANASSRQLTAVATDVDGNVGTSAAVEVTVGTMTLTELQSSVFTPICSSCHTGVGTALPGVQDLTAGHSFASIVGVASIEQPSLMRIKANDVANSYVIRKLAGDPSISNARMPLGGPYLDRATMDKFKTWINNGAPDN